LTLQELIHIRSVLTKAEIESLPVEGNFKEDVENRKVYIIYFIMKDLKWVYKINIFFVLGLFLMHENQIWHFWTLGTGMQNVPTYSVFKMLYQGNISEIDLYRIFDFIVK